MDRHRVCLGFAFALLAGSAAAQVPIGGEFHVNTYTVGNQGIPYVAADAAGKFVVVWTSIGQDGSGMGVFGQRFDASGAPVGPEFAVNTYTTSHQRGAAVAAAPSGEFIVTWTSAGGDDGDGRGVFARRYDSSGTPGAAFQVNSFTTGYQTNPAVAVDASGNFIVAWLSAAQDGDSWGIYAQRYDASASPQGGEFRVNATTTGPQGNVAVFHGPERELRGVLGYRLLHRQLSGARPALQRRGIGARGRAGGDHDRGDVVQRLFVGGAGRGWRLRRGVDQLQLRRKPEWRVRPPVRRVRRAPGHRVPGEHLHEWLPGERKGGRGRRRQLRGGLAELPQPGRAWRRLLRPAFRPLRRPYGQRFRPDLIFRDGFESGTVSAWSANSADGGDLSVSGPAAQAATTQGLQGLVDDVVGLWVQDNSPNDEARYRARFYIDPNGFDTGEAALQRRTRTFIAFTEAPSRRVAAVVLRRLNGVYAIMGRARQDDGLQIDTGFFTVSDAPHVVEIDLQPASDPDALDGRLQLWIDGVSQSELTGLDNSLAMVDFARLGVLSVKSAANGTLYWDEFESRRGTYIGLVP